MKVSGSARLTFNASLNLAGQGIPMVLGIFLIPDILRGLGTERFGLLTLAWTLIGVFTLFDFGFGRAVTHGTSKAITEGDTHRVARIASTGIASTFLFGCIGGIALWTGANHLISRLHVQSDLSNEARAAIRVVALGIPLVTAMSGTRALLESLASWRFINVYRIVMGIGNFIGPFVFLGFTVNVAWIIAFLVLIRLVALVHHLIWARHLWPELNFLDGWSRKEFVNLFKFGGWMMVSNFVSPLMVYADRFFIGSWIGLQAVTYYATPVDVLTRVLIIPNSLVAALFPLVTEQLHRNGDEAEHTYKRSVTMMSVLMIPFGIVGVVFAHPLLSLWMGAAFADQASLVFKIVSIGVAANGFSAIPFALIQASGRPDVTAKLHLIELPIYVVLLLLCLQRWGLAGAAMAWTIRLILDAFVLFFVWNRLSQRRKACQIPC